VPCDSGRGKRGPVTPCQAPTEIRRDEAVAPRDLRVREIGTRQWMAEIGVVVHLASLHSASKATGVACYQ
jgi:hypothetical protein